jgi:hypothetical protein
MEMGREAIADKGVWTAKKRYILNLYDMEGVRYKEPKLKIMGLEAVKSSTPAPCREKLKEAIKLIMNGDEKLLNTFIQDFREEFMSLPAEDIAYPRSCNGLKKFRGTDRLFALGAPKHVKGAILYNHLVDENNLGNKYVSIQEGDKVKFVNLRQNIYQASAFSFMTKIPPELEILPMVDYTSQYEDSFLAPLRVITDKMNWILKNDEVGTLEDFFG